MTNPMTIHRAVNRKSGGIGVAILAEEGIYEFHGKGGFEEFLSPSEILLTYTNEVTELKFQSIINQLNSMQRV